MLKWNDVINFATNGDPTPSKKVVKTDEQWRMQLSEDEYYVTRKKGTERPDSSGSCTLLEPGKYVCICCDNLLFDADEMHTNELGHIIENRVMLTAMHQQLQQQHRQQQPDQGRNSLQSKAQRHC